MQALTPDEILKVLKVASTSKRNHAMILCAFRFGMRASEVCNLRLTDIDAKNGSITIRRLKGSRTTVAALTNVSGQPLLSVARVLKAWLDERDDASQYVFTSQKGGRLDRQAFFRMFQTVATEAGMPKDKRHLPLLKALARIRHGCSQSEPYYRPERSRASLSRFHRHLCSAVPRTG